MSRKSTGFYGQQKGDLTDSEKPALLYMFEPAPKASRLIPFKTDFYSAIALRSLLYTSQEERFSDFNTIFLSLFSIVT